MTKIKRAIIYGVLLVIIASVLSLIIGLYEGKYYIQDVQSFWIVWISSLIPTAISGFISAFLYYYLCESKKKWVHILWFLINLAFVVTFGAFLVFVVLNSMLN